MKKQALGMIAALFAFMLMLPVGAYASDAAPDVYAILYTDGELVFQYGDATDGRAVLKTYEVDLSAVYTYRVGQPWYNERESVLVVDFADKISPTSTAYWFHKCRNLERVDNIENLDTANVTDMKSMFDGCWDLTALDVSHFDTANVTDMSHMFSGCTILTALDVSHFNTANVTDMQWMFNVCGGLESLDVSHFDTANVTNMNSMFYGCGNLKSLDVSNFDTANVTDMGYMFRSCSDLRSLDLSRWDTANVTDMGYMFQWSGLRTIYVSEKFKVNPKSSHLGSGCFGLVGGAGTRFNNSYGFFSRIDTPSAPGYFTYKPFSPDEYVIAYAVAGNGKLSVVFSNPGDATLAVSYFDENGKFLSAQLQDAQANAGMTVALELPEGAKTARVMLLDGALCPLCAAYAADVGGAA